MRGWFEMTLGGPVIAVFQKCATTFVKIYMCYAIFLEACLNHVNS